MDNFGQGFTRSEALTGFVPTYNENNSGHNQK